MGLFPCLSLSSRRKTQSILVGLLGPSTLPQRVWLAHKHICGFFKDQMEPGTKKRSDGTFKAYTSPMTSNATMLQEDDLSSPIHNVSAPYSNGHMIIFASLQLPANTTLVNHVWQEQSLMMGLWERTLCQGLMFNLFGTLDFAPSKVLQNIISKLNSRITLGNVRNMYIWSL